MRRVSAPAEKGFHRVAWDLRFAASGPAKLPSEKEEKDPWDAPDEGPMAAPGTYRVELAQRVAGTVTGLAGSQQFRVVSLGLATLAAHDKAAVLTFEQKTARLQRAVLGAVEATKEARARLARIKVALAETPAARSELADQARAIEARLADLQMALSGDRVLEKYSEPTPPSIEDRVQGIVYSLWATSQAPTGSMQDAYTIAADEFSVALPKLQNVIQVDLAKLQDAMEKAGAPWTPGRVPTWTKE